MTETPNLTPEVEPSSFLDGLLRNREAIFQQVFDGHGVGRLNRKLAAVSIGLLAFFGVIMGSVGFSAEAGVNWPQAFAAGVKVPALFFVSLAVCFPALYFVLVLLGSKLNLGQTLALILIALTMNAVLLAGFGPMAIFFRVTGASYAFMKIFTVVAFVFCGGWAMFSLWQGLNRMCEVSSLYPRQAMHILRIWTLIFGFVGVQLAWSLRPFMGTPGAPFEWFRADQTGNFYQMVGSSIIDLVPVGKFLPLDD